MAKGDRGEQKRRLLSAAREWITREGKVPGVRRFATNVGVGKETWSGRLWPSWGAFLAEAGAKTPEFTQPIAEDDLLNHRASLTRGLKKFRSSAQLKYATNDTPGVPSEKTLRNRFGRADEMAGALLNWVRGRAEWRDVEAILATRSPPVSRAPAPDKTAVQTSDLFSEHYLPPVVGGLARLAGGGDAVEKACAVHGVSLSVEFERRVQIALELLGFEIERLGQGSGRVADGIARWPQARFAVIYDAKVRRGGFAISRDFISHGGTVGLQMTRTRPHELVFKRRAA